MRSFSLAPSLLIPFVVATSCQSTQHHEMNAETAETVVEAMEAAAPAKLAPFAKEGFHVIEEEGRLWVFREGSESLAEFLEKQLDGLEDGGVRQLDLEDVKDLELTPAGDLRRAIAGKTPTRTERLSLASTGSEGEDSEDAGWFLQIADVDGDGASDLVLVARDDDAASERRVVLFVTR